MTDHNEAMRLAEILKEGSRQFNEDAAALLIKQAERIAELESRVHTCGPTCSKAGCINRRLTAERDQLRAEVERLRADGERLDHIEKHARCDPKMDGQHVWWPTNFKHALRGPTLRAALDATRAQKDEG